MSNNLRVGLGIGLFSLLTVLPAGAQEAATLALRSGERPSGELVDMNASGFVMRINGQERAFPASEVTAVEFVVGGISSEAQAKVHAGQPFVMLRNGQLVDGRLSDVGGTHPLRLTVDTPSGARDFSSSDVAQIWLNSGGKAPGGIAGHAGEEGIPAGAIVVPANVAWTDTGITVNNRSRLTFNATGNIMLAEGLSSGIGGSPAATAPNLKYPVADAPAGALIGRIGNGRPFLIGGNTQPQMSGSGRLMLGVNDDHVPDNSGSFYVVITK